MRILDRYERLVRQGLRLIGTESHYRVIAGRQIHYYELAGTGPGPALLLLHGLGANATSFFPVLSGLRKAWRRIYVPDLPGHGFSLHDPGQAPLDIRGHGEVLWTFVQEVIREPIGIIGSSMGGALALGLAVEKTEHVRGVGLLSPAGAPFTEEDLKDIRVLFDPKSRRNVMQFLGRLTHRPLLPGILVAHELRAILGGPAPQHILRSYSPDERLSEQSLRELPMPVLFIWGASEKLLPAHFLPYFRQNLPPQTRIEVLERCGHMPYLEQPGRTLKLLNELGAAAAAYKPRIPVAAAV